MSSVRGTERAIVVLDTETTGLDSRRDRIIDIGAVRLGPGLDVEARFSRLVDPGIPIPLAVTRLVGLCDDDVCTAPAFGEALEELREFAGDALLAGHNVAFDRDHLTSGIVRAGLRPLANEWFDTLEAAMLLYPELDAHNLAALSDGFGLERQTHRALPDAEAAAEVFRRLCQRAACLGLEERSLLTSSGWRPLAVLDAFPMQCPPPPPLDAPPGKQDTGPLPVLQVHTGDWLAELDPEEGEDRSCLAARLPGYARRAGQLQFASAAAETLDQGGVGLFEAGTGMGKSLAYLLPAAFYSAALGRRVIVSTKTKALQRQLAAHELPLVAGSLPPDWRWSVLMGRENYLCRRRLDEAMAEAGEMLPDHERAFALAYLLGRVRRGEVDLSRLPYRASRELTALPGLARELRSTRASCMGRHCPRRSVCLWRAARRRAETSHLVCVNHALLLTGRDTLPPFDDVVIDEAHLLYHEAGEAFSDRIDSARLSTLLSDLGTGGKRRLARRLLAAARRSGPAEARILAHAAHACERAAASLPGLIRSMGEALSAVAAYAAAVRREDGRRPPETGGEGYDVSVWLTHGLREDSSWDGLVTVSALLAEELTALAAATGAALETISEEHADHPAVAAVADHAAALAGLLEELSEPSGEEHVLWAEIEASRTFGSPGQPGAAWSVTRTPLVPGRQVREALWDRLHSAVLASATLTVAGSFSYFRDMSGLGADLDVRQEVFPSPFDFRRQAVLLLEHDPHSAWRPQELAERQGERIKRLAEVTRGRMLALFTNKRDMQRVAAAVGAHVEADGVLVLAQGLHGSAAALAEEFRTHPQTILLGVDTLWTGQDFPGDALVCLVIAKLPFPRQDPLFQARRRAYEEAGESWFQRFYLPEAVLKFRQGFGRLIRTETDSGVVVVLDHRLAEKGYRRQFLASIPELEVLEVSPADLPAAVEDNLLRLTDPACVPARKR